MAWYGTDREGPADDAQGMGKSFAADGALWRLVVARSRDGGRTMTLPRNATPVLARGRICTGSSTGGCGLPGSRVLYDCFGVSLDRSGRFTAVYTSALPRTSLGEATASHSEYVTDPMLAELHGFVDEYVAEGGPVDMLEARTKARTFAGRDMHPQRLHCVALTVEVTTQLLEVVEEFFRDAAAEVGDWPSTTAAELTPSTRARLERIRSRRRDRPTAP
ncbi:MAG: hypothetical protein JJD92_09245 [Frankiaceae bacterium]|nr:hypothetical protein [Frankiaceae bacterium]